MSRFTASMFEDIKNSLEANKGGNSNFRDILKTEPGNSYLARLVPNVKEPKRTIHHYYHHVWQSEKTGQYVSGQCPTTWGDPCPVCLERMKLYRENTEESKRKAYLLKRKENWLVNIYVIDDPKNPDNNGQIKILRYGKQIQKIIDEAMTGEDAEEFGPAIFDLSKNGCSLRLKVETNEGGYPSYVSSRFLTKKAIPGMTAQKIEEIHNNIFDLDKLFDLSTQEELEGLLEHVGISVDKPVSTKSTKSTNKNQDSEDDNSEDDNSEDDNSEDDNSEDDNSEENDSEENDSEENDPEENDDTDAKIADLLKDL